MHACNKPDSGGRQPMPAAGAADRLPGGRLRLAHRRSRGGGVAAVPILVLRTLSVQHTHSHREKVASRRSARGRKVSVYQRLRGWVRGLRSRSLQVRTGSGQSGRWAWYGRKALVM